MYSLKKFREKDLKQAKQANFRLPSKTPPNNATQGWWRHQFAWA